MKLDRFEIRNFRSIKDIKIPILEIDGKKCLILVGKNEAGKSNILKAIAAVFGKYRVGIKDQNKNTKKEDHGYIRAVFKLERHDFSIINKKIIEKYKLKDTNIFQNSLSIEQFIEEAFCDILLRIKIENDTKPCLAYWKNDDLYNKYQILEALYYDTSSKSILPFENTQNSLGSNEEFLNDLMASIFSIAKSNIASIEDLCEQAIFWEYSDKYLLPSSVNIQSFKDDPSMCLPLKNIFYLNGCKDIYNEIETELEKDKGLHGFLDKISKNTTKEFRKIWSDLRNINFVIRKDGDEFDIRIQEQEFYSTEDRSDGFKRFIAILLMLSVQDRTKDLCGKIILFDEPDTFLYPTSANFLKEELLKIAKQSIVIYSTHSPFMIDNDCIDRHLVIERKDDVSNIIPQDKSPYKEDELLKRAIGTHLFESIRPKNIIFEGYTDYKVFKKNCKQKDFENCGLVYMNGIKDADCISRIMMLTGKKFIIVSDSDKASKDKKKEFIIGSPDLKENWIEYDIIQGNIKTLEDFYKDEYINKVLKKEGFSNYEHNSELSVIENINRLNLSREAKHKIKNKMSNEITKKDLKEEYFNFIAKIKDIVQAL
ncbi:ATP-dependent endonuclease [Campylobacter sp. CCUG 57310]|uniref:ATP-dependent nuclease n=1 Tax=Campylobacter sp. CCUG 57310 TaxID=2517362 RepID=UPI0015652F17|nr:AAA family ATPase [Campylobacter sp. CCUG 57310]QKF93097.1 ATP-binding protein (AAA domain) [Campylobacter sp. CCUG 57310]